MHIELISEFATRVIHELDLMSLNTEFLDVSRSRHLFDQISHVER